MYAFDSLGLNINDLTVVKLIKTETRTVPATINEKRGDTQLYPKVYGYYYKGYYTTSTEYEITNNKTKISQKVEVVKLIGIRW